jgi:hypothetical protein
MDPNLSGALVRAAAKDDLAFSRSVLGCGTPPGGVQNPESPA